jgi:hypothetical protein
MGRKPGLRVNMPALRRHDPGRQAGRPPQQDHTKTMENTE